VRGLLHRLRRLFSTPAAEVDDLVTLGGASRNAVAVGLEKFRFNLRLHPFNPLFIGFVLLFLRQEKSVSQMSMSLK